MYRHMYKVHVRHTHVQGMTHRCAGRHATWTRVCTCVCATHMGDMRYTRGRMCTFNDSSAWKRPSRRGMVSTSIVLSRPLASRGTVHSRNARARRPCSVSDGSSPVCACVCVCVRMHGFIYICICVHMYVSVHAHM